MIADLKKQIISPKHSRPIIQLVQDAVLGVFKMTELNSEVDKKFAMNFLSSLYLYDDNLNQEYFNKNLKSSDLLSHVMPNNMYITAGTGAKEIKIIDGKIRSGVINSGFLNNLMITYIVDKYCENQKFNGNDNTAIFIDNVQKMALKWLMYEGATVGLGDAEISLELDNRIKEEIAKKSLKINYLITDYENRPESNVPESFEKYIYSDVKTFGSDLSKIIESSVSKTNNFRCMIEAGSKGSIVNISQIMSAICQNEIKFQRIEKKIAGRTLPHEFHGDDSARSRGFIENSYYSGLNPTEFFFHHMAGREGLIDTGIKTADTGYLQRKLVKCMEDITISYDGTVRNGNNIIQFVYGDNNLDQTMQRANFLSLIKITKEDIKNNFTFSNEQMKTLTKKYKQKDLTQLNEELYNSVLEIRNKLRKYLIDKKARNTIFIETFYQPVYFKRIIEDASYATFDKTTELDPFYVMEKIEFILRPDISKFLYLSNSDIKNKNSIRYNTNKSMKLLFKAFLYDYLSPVKLIFNHKLSKEKFDMVVKNIIYGFDKAIVDPGSMVGVISAQSFGESLTQMSVHSASQISIRVKNKHLGEKIIKITIGEFIDSIINNYPTKVKNIGHDSVELNINECYNDTEFYIPSVYNTEKVKWTKLSHVSRHPANGDLLKIKTYSGRSIVTTKSHSHLSRTNNGIVPVRGDKLKIKDRIPTLLKLNMEKQNYTFVDKFNTTINLTEEMGWIFGAFLADGDISKNKITITKIDKDYINCIKNHVKKEFDLDIKTVRGEGAFGPSVKNSFNCDYIARHLTEYYKCGSFDKSIPDYVHNSNLDFVKGLLRGYFDGDGNINASKRNIRVGSRSKTLIQDLSTLYRYFGIFTSLYKEYTKISEMKTNEKYAKKDGKHKDQVPFYCLNILTKYADVYLDKIGCDTDYKRDALIEIIDYQENVSDKYSKDKIDMIPELGEIFYNCGSKLHILKQYRQFYKYKMQNTVIGRENVKKWIDLFREDVLDKNVDLSEELAILEQAVNSDVVWDEIIEIKEIKDPKTFVYDFTVPGPQNFMIYNGIFTHNTLNTFHTTGSGVKGMQGIPRFKEIMNYTKHSDDPYMVIYLKEEFATKKELAYKITSFLRKTIMLDVISNGEIIYDPIIDLADYPVENYNNHDNIETKNAFYLNNSNKNLSNMPWLYRFKINSENLFKYNIQLIEIKTEFIKNWLDKTFDYISDSKKNRKSTSFVNNFAVLSSFENDDDLYVHFRFDINNPTSDNLLDLYDLIVYKFRIKGVDEITEAEVKEEKYTELNDDVKDGEVKKTNYVIYTTGINIDIVKRLRHVDFSKLIINDLKTTFDYYGIEAARKVIISEVDKVYTGNGIPINYCHLTLFADIMTNVGTITSVDRNGIIKRDVGPIAKASFEKTIDHFINAAAFNEVDDMSGVSACIMFGKMFKGGTGAFDLIFNDEMVLSYEPNYEITQPINTISISQNTLIKDYDNKMVNNNIYYPE